MEVYLCLDLTRRAIFCQFIISLAFSRLRNTFSLHCIVIWVILIGVCTALLLWGLALGFAGLWDEGCLEREMQSDFKKKIRIFACLLVDLHSYLHAYSCGYRVCATLLVTPCQYWVGPLLSFRMDLILSGINSTRCCTFTTTSSLCSFLLSDI